MHCSTKPSEACHLIYQGNSSMCHYENQNLCYISIELCNWCMPLVPSLNCITIYLFLFKQGTFPHLWPCKEPDSSFPVNGKPAPCEWQAVFSIAALAKDSSHTPDMKTTMWTIGGSWSQCDAGMHCMEAVSRGGKKPTCSWGRMFSKWFASAVQNPHNKKWKCRTQSNNLW